ncbi:hypothetical protein GCM10025867_37630 [Frondihabitans sucicola]|uniref:Uncharacterized protein n=1 Tax=Frondihabitans sucicola TaxID=1268041 RepID=A0ABM8GST5_9MICO|nr:hypothetical protein [Frondihabitans sucicola]BDZ51522.1 hypothetical protein GCM10025867_37630 [Frondihabitans sucicola]
MTTGDTGHDGSTGPDASREELFAEIERLRAEVAALEAAQVERWTDFVANTRSEILAHRALVTDMRGTLSWRITKPIRGIRGLGARGLGRK